MASAPLFVINLHGVMFALAGVVAGQQLARRHRGQLLCWRTGQARVLPAPCSTGEEMPGLWEASGGGIPSLRVWDARCALKCRDVGSRSGELGAEPAEKHRAGRDTQHTG